MNDPDPNDPLRELFQQQRAAVRESAPAWTPLYLREQPAAPKRRRITWVVGFSTAAACLVITILLLKPSGSGGGADLTSLPSLLPPAATNEAVIPLTASVIPNFESTTDFLLPQTKPVIQIL